MRVSLEDWNNGWVEVEVSLSASDVDRLIALLQKIKADPDQHFHATSNVVGSGGIGQITFQMQQPGETDNFGLGGLAMGEGESIVPA